MLLPARVAELLALLDAGYCYRRLAWSDCPLVTTVSRAKTDETIEMPFGLWTRVQGQKTVCYVGVQIPEGAILGVVPSLKCIKLCKQQARGCRLIRRGQRITTKVRLQNGLTHRGGDKCRGDATLRQNSLTTCSLQRTSMCVCVCVCVCACIQCKTDTEVHGLQADVSSPGSQATSVSDDHRADGHHERTASVTA